MIAEFSGTDDALRQYIAVVAYFMPRTLAFVWFFPILSKGEGSNFIKMIVAAVLVLYPAFSVSLSVAPGVGTPSASVLTFVSEVLLGTLMGMTIAMPYFAFKGFGALLDVYRGATFAAQATGNDSGEELPLETLFGYYFAALLFAGPGLQAVTQHLLNSYLLLPPGQLEIVSLNTWVQALMGMVVDHIVFAVVLAMPVLMAVLVVEMALEVLSPFTQQLQVYNLQYGFRSVFGIAGLLLVFHFAEDNMLGLFKDYSQQLNRLMEGFL